MLAHPYSSIHTLGTECVHSSHPGVSKYTAEHGILSKQANQETVSGRFRLLKEISSSSQEIRTECPENHAIDSKWFLIVCCLAVGF